MSISDLTNAIEQSHAALGAILKGDPSVYQALYSSADDVTLADSSRTSDLGDAPRVCSGLHFPSSTPPSPDLRAVQTLTPSAMTRT